MQLEILFQTVLHTQTGMCNVLWDICLYALIEEPEGTGLRRTGEDRPMGKKHCREDRENNMHQQLFNLTSSLVCTFQNTVITHCRVLKQKCGGHRVATARLQWAGQQARSIRSTFIIQKHLLQRNMTPSQSRHSGRVRDSRSYRQMWEYI